MMLLLSVVLSIWLSLIGGGGGGGAAAAAAADDSNDGEARGYTLICCWLLVDISKCDGGGC